MSLGFALDLVREIRWAWPISSCSAGVSLPLALLLVLLGFLCGCCCGGLAVLALVSSSFRRALCWIGATCASALVVDPPVPPDALRRRFAQYRPLHEG